VTAATASVAFLVVFLAGAFLAAALAGVLAALLADADLAFALDSDFLGAVVF
jgi:hypothetical protein